jgi:hypothetical protein
MKIKHRAVPFPGLAALAALSLAAAAAPARAAYLSGTLASEYNLISDGGTPNPLATAALGGSFSGTFSTDGLPLLAPNDGVDLTTFNIQLFDTGGNTLVTYSNTNPDDQAFVQFYTYQGQTLNTLNFEATSNILGAQNSALQFAFPDGFAGMGMSNLAIEGFYASYSTGTDTQGQNNPPGPFTRIRELSATAVPEPSTWAAFAALMIAGLIVRPRQRRTA